MKRATRIFFSLFLFGTASLGQTDSTREFSFAISDAQTWTEPGPISLPETSFIQRRAKGNYAPTNSPALSDLFDLFSF